MIKARCMTVLMALSSTVFADTALTGDQVKQLVSVNCIDVHSNVRGLPLSRFH